MSADDRYLIKGLASGLHLLDVIASNPHKTLGELAELSELSISQTFRLLHTLHESGYVARGANKTYHLHSHSVAVGYSAQRNHPMVVVSRDVLDDLLRHTGENCHLVVRTKLTRVIVDMRYAHDRVRSIALLGNIDPLYYGGTGLTILAHSPEELIEAVLGGNLSAPTSQTVVDPDEIRATLAKIRERGYHLAREDFAHRAFSVAAPIYDAEGECNAAICVFGQLSRLTPENESRLIEMTQLAAGEITRRLKGHASPPSAVLLDTEV